VTLAPLGVRTPLGAFVFCRYQVAVRGYCTRLFVAVIPLECRVAQELHQVPTVAFLLLNGPTSDLLIFVGS
jgi:hypothetical protein